jgi:hypothetical protein
MARVCATGPIVWLTFDPREAKNPWLADYFPSLWHDAALLFPAIGEVCGQLAKATGREVGVQSLLLPWDLEDCFLGAGWRRPEVYLDPEVRACMSAFALADNGVVNVGLRQLASDLESGSWQSTFGDLLAQDAIDWGYRFLIAK